MVGGGGRCAGPWLSLQSPWGKPPPEFNIQQGSLSNTQHSITARRQCSTPRVQGPKSRFHDAPAQVKTESEERPKARGQESSMKVGHTGQRLAEGRRTGEAKGRTQGWPTPSLPLLYLPRNQVLEAAQLVLVLGVVPGVYGSWRTQEKLDRGSGQSTGASRAE